MLEWINICNFLEQHLGEIVIIFFKSCLTVQNLKCTLSCKLRLRMSKMVIIIVLFGAWKEHFLLLFLLPAKLGVAHVMIVELHAIQQEKVLLTIK